MLANWPIRYKLLLKLCLLLVIVVALSTAGMIGLYSYRDLVKAISRRASELPFATALGQQVADLRVTLTEISQLGSIYRARAEKSPLDGHILYEQFGLNLQTFEQTLAKYRKQLNGNESSIPSIGRSHDERQTARKIEDTLTRIKAINSDKNWILDEAQVVRVDGDLQMLQLLCAELPSYLHSRMQNFTDEVRVRYRTLIYITWACTLLAVVVLVLFVRLFFRWVFGPLQILIKGSRLVASGNFNHRIHLDADDEMAVLAGAMNSMTERFQAIRDDLDQQVRQRTIQMVRTEKLASVGFLAAGVAHEINNPMASIAMSAESLERQVDRGAVADTEQAEGARRYLRMIQDEAFRCKEITAQLLDFSRTGNGQRENTDLRDLIQGVLDMIQLLSKNQAKRIELAPCKSVIAVANAQEIKQVVLNLITNAMDSIDSKGEVKLQLGIHENMAEVIITDNGCGMTDEVRQNLFEPFFTRRRNGQGTGLGLSIAYRIIEDHGGRMEAESDGPGKGSRFRVMLPLAGSQQAHETTYRAA